VFCIDKLLSCTWLAAVDCGLWRSVDRLGLGSFVQPLQHAHLNLFVAGCPFPQRGLFYFLCETFLILEPFGSLVGYSLPGGVDGLPC